MNVLEIKRYWDERAVLHPESATTDDVLLRDLEFETLARRIRALRPRIVLDVGCGDGQTTARLARAFPEVRFDGCDYSDAMVALASQMAAAGGEMPPNLEFEVRDLFETGGDYDLAMTTRVLINLPDVGAQLAARDHLEAIAYNVVMIENFVGPHERLNRLRREVGLEEIAVRPHNLFLSDDTFQSEGFADAYYYVTRVVYSKLCQDTGAPINYRHPLCKVAKQLPQGIGLNIAPMRVIEL